MRPIRQVTLVLNNQGGYNLCETNGSGGKCSLWRLKNLLVFLCAENGCQVLRHYRLVGYVDYVIT